MIASGLGRVFRPTAIFPGGFCRVICQPSQSFYRSGFFPGIYNKLKEKLSETSCDEDGAVVKVLSGHASAQSKSI